MGSEAGPKHLDVASLTQAYTQRHWPDQGPTGQHDDVAVCRGVESGAILRLTLLIPGSLLRCGGRDGLTVRGLERM